jgi:hypothetical protein
MAVRLAGGRYKLAENLISNEEERQKKKALRDDFRKALKGGVNAGLRLAEKISRDEEVLMELTDEGMVYLMQFLKQCLKVGREQRLIEKVFQMTELLFQKKILLEETNASKRLQLEDFFIQIN